MSYPAQARRGRAPTARMRDETSPHMFSVRARKRKPHSEHGEDGYAGPLGTADIAEAVFIVSSRPFLLQKAGHFSPIQLY